MKIKHLTPFLIIMLFMMSCKKDDDGGNKLVLRDLGKVTTENDAKLKAYLETHFYNYEAFADPPKDFNYQIVFDTIAGNNSDKTPLIKQVKDTLIKVDNVPQKMYYLIARKGGTDKKPRLGDEIFCKYETRNISGKLLDESTTGTSFRTLNEGVRMGFVLLSTKLTIGTGYKENEDGTITWNENYGIGASFVPAGLAYYSTGNYNPFVFTMDMLQFNEVDQDFTYDQSTRANVVTPDGVPSSKEDPNKNGDPRDDDTDKDGVPNYLDPDDDGDGILTKYEYDALPDNNKNGVVDEGDGDGIPDDRDNDGIPDYLDPDNQR